MGLIDNEMLDRALIFFERAKSLDPENMVVDSFLSMVRIVTLGRVMAEDVRRKDPELGTGSKG